MSSPPDGKSSFARRFAAGNESAFEEMQNRYRERLARWATARIGTRFNDRIDPESIYQLMAISVYRYLKDPSHEPNFRNSGDVLAWLFTKMRYALDERIEWEEAIKRPPAGKGCDADEVALFGSEPLPGDVVISKDLIDKLVEGLGSPYPEIVALLLLGHTQCEIAEILGVGREYVKGKIKRLRERLAMLLRQCEHPSM